MAKASFELDTTQLIALLNDVRDQAPTVAARALNKSAKSAKTAMVKVVRADVGLKAGTVRDAITLVEARPGPEPTAKLRVSKKRIPLIEFNARQLKRAGVKANLKGGARTYPGAFIARTKSGHRGVFKRKTYPRGPRLPIVQLRGPSLAKVFVKHWKIGVARFREQLPKNLSSELRFQSRRSRRI